MATAPTRRVIARSPGRAAPPRSGVAADCRWCKVPVLWLRSTTTGHLAPIDATPAPGGNVNVHRDAHGTIEGTYDVVPAPRPRAAVQEETLEVLDVLEVSDAWADLGGGLDSIPDTEVPRLHWNHWATCRNRTARNMAARRAATGAAPGPLRTIDGDPVDPRSLRTTRPDARPVVLAPPAEVTQALRRCRRCLQPMDAQLADAGARYHPLCDPDARPPTGGSP